MLEFLEGISHLNGSVDSVIGHVKLHCIVGVKRYEPPSFHPDGVTNGKRWGQVVGATGGES